MNENIKQQVKAVGTNTIVFHRENPFYPVETPVEVTIFSERVHGAKVIQWGEGIVPISNFISRGFVTVL